MSHKMHSENKMKNYGIAIDVGTTNVSACLVDLCSKKELARKIVLNSQGVYGEDVISRIDFAIRKKDGLAKLNKKAIDTINSLISLLTRQSGVKKDEIVKAVVVGNSAMNHFLLGISPRSLGLSPYKAALTEPVVLSAKDTFIRINKTAEIRFPANIGGFVGSDALAMIFSAGINKSHNINLAVDIGTNGEAVLGKKGEIFALSTAAGPAFEAEDEGICGSDLIDIVAGLLKAGKIGKSGLLEGKKSKINENITISQKDIRRFQLAKAAIRAGIKILLDVAGENLENVSEIFIAGTFGKSINIENAVSAGLIPNIDKERIKIAGNAALEGAKMFLVDDELFEYSAVLAKKIHHIKLFGRKNFKEEFTKALLF